MHPDIDYDDTDLPRAQEYAGDALGAGRCVALEGCLRCNADEIVMVFEGGAKECACCGQRSGSPEHALPAWLTDGEVAGVHLAGDFELVFDEAFEPERRAP